MSNVDSKKTEDALIFEESEIVSVINRAVKIVSEGTGRKLDVNDIPDDDKAVFEIINSGEMDDLLLRYELIEKGFNDFEISSMEDITAALSLDRPGLEERRKVYFSNRKNPKKYGIPKLDAILEPTFGCIVYREQILQILKELGGFTPELSKDGLREMAKYHQTVFADLRKTFIFGDNKNIILGCVGMGLSESEAGRIFDNMSEVARYTFNKSHAASYAIMIYRLAWLKYYYGDALDKAYKNEE